jgi:[ribosomal protein S5]-alanine N-acetyltransferase
LETKRCYLIKLQRTDFEDVEKIYTNEKVREYLGGPIPKEHTLKKFEDTLERINKDLDSFYWIVRLKNNNDFIGLVSLSKHHDGINIEVSYEFLPNWWGFGYASEVISRIINFAFDQLNLPKIVAETQTANLSSCSLLERIGMKLEQTVHRFGAEQVIYGIER